MDISSGAVAQLQKNILDWYAGNKRDLPWRKTRDPYAILISEVMLQQTQVNRVITKYQDWLFLFPDIRSLAQAKLVDILQAWSGLGYNRRAVYLHKLAWQIVHEYQGQFPQDEKTLVKLPGIGRYTARSLLCFAFDQQIAVVDTNVKKVILTKILHTQHAEERTIEKIASQILPQGKAYIWNQALMDYSSAVLKKEKIAIPKQTVFQNSDRYYRGSIIKLLLQKGWVSKSEIQQHFSTHKQYVSQERLEGIIYTLMHDSLLVFDHERAVYTFP